MNDRSMVSRLIVVAEEFFDCSFGPEQAFFEWPQRDGDTIRFIYCSYVVRGDDLKKLEQYFIDEVLAPLAEKAGDEGRLYWRLDTCFEVQLDTSDGRYTVRTRIVVVDKDLNEVRLPDEIKPEGQPIKVVE